MLHTIKLFIQLCFFRGSPEALPYSKVLLFALVLVQFFLTATYWGKMEEPATLMVAWQATIFSVLLSFAFVYFILRLKNITDRLVKAPSVREVVASEFN